MVKENDILEEHKMIFLNPNDQGQSLLLIINLTLLIKEGLVEYGENIQKIYNGLIK